MNRDQVRHPAIQPPIDFFYLIVMSLSVAQRMRVCNYSYLYVALLMALNINTVKSFALSLLGTRTNYSLLGLVLLAGARI